MESRAKEYSRKKQELRLFNLALTPLVLFVAVATPLSWQFQQWATAVSANAYATVFFYFAFFSLYCLIFDLPLSYYSGFYLEHRYELSNQTFGQWLKDMAKKSLLSFVLSAVLILALYALIWRFAASWWLYAWGGYACVSYLLGKVFPVWIVPLFYQYGALEDGALRERLLAMASKYGMPAKEVYSINLSKTTKKANAAFMGIGKTKRIVLSDTLLERFSHDEIEMVIAHELGHFKHKDIWRQLALGLISSWAAFAAAFYLMPVLTGFLGSAGVSDVSALPLLFLVFYFFGMGLMPLQNAFSRSLERQADRFALEASPHTQAFISCMEKLGEVNLSDPDPHPVYEWFFYDHPSIKRRVAVGRGYLNDAKS